MPENQHTTERLKYFIDAKKMTVNTFETKCDTNSTLRNAINKRKGITSETFAKIITTFPELNANWLLIGEGEMIKKNENENNYYNQDIVNSAAAESVATYNTMNECEKEVATLKQRVKDLEKQVELFEMLLKK